jgi:hypothetical protein
LTIATGIGRLMSVKVDDMDVQAARLGAATKGAAAPMTLGAYAVVAVAAGEGLANALREAGCAQVVSGGQTMNPSTRDILDAIERCDTEHVIVLPNNKNIIWTADQAAKLIERSVLVVPTISIPQGIAALLALNPDDEPEAVQSAMREAAARVRTIEITNAARTASVNGVAVRQGEPIGLIDDDLRVAAPTPDEAAVAALRLLDVGEAPFITVYYGRDVAEGAAAALSEVFSGLLPEAEVAVLAGGQPFYQYVISVE